MSFDSVEALEASAKAGGETPAGMNDALKALWLTKAGQWDAAHEVAQDMKSKMGDWIHALLHLIEGDIGNSAYWYNRAGKPQPGTDGIDEEWLTIARAVIDQS